MNPVACFLLATCFIFGSSVDLFAQSPYWIFFRDKPNAHLADSSCWLSESARVRRTKQHISIDISDAPVEQNYLQAIQGKGGRIRHTSRWLNAISVQANDKQLAEIARLPFVKGVQPVLRSDNVISGTSEEFAYGSSGEAIRLLEIDYLHRLNLLGQGKKVAVLDAGFLNLNKIPAFKHLFTDQRILATIDKVDGDTSVYNVGSHGTNVVSLINALLPETFVGVSPRSNYFLIRTENNASEHPSEEDNWIASAEWADSAGADIIQSSLNYNTFDDPKFNHQIKELDGKTIPISRAANMAARKGILVVNSVGNEGRTSWRYLTPPSDADSILAVGAIQMNGNLAALSSIGPSADKRIKPDVVAPGADISILNTDGGLRTGSGTSFASPLIAGMGALLWQAFPESPAMRVRDAILRSADKFTTPDTFYGYGLPNGRRAYIYLQSFTQRDHHPAEVMFTVSPNPAQDFMTISARQTDSSARWQVMISDLAGRILYREEFSPHQPDWHHILWLEESSFPTGVYLLQLKNESNTGQEFRTKVVVVR